MEIITSKPSVEQRITEPLVDNPDEWSWEKRKVLKGGTIRFRHQVYTNPDVDRFRGKVAIVYYNFVKPKPIWIEVEDQIFRMKELESAKAEKPEHPPCDAQMLYEIMLLTGAGVMLEDMPESEVLSIFESWTQQQRDEAETYFASVQAGAMAGEWNEDYPAVNCPEHLKQYGCYDMAPVRRLK